ncbi:MAG: SbcC/MukB-like Walker B domain-containing protein, partial [Marmoricola sp.]
ALDEELLGDGVLDDGVLDAAIRSAELRESELRAALPRVRRLVQQRAELAVAEADTARAGTALAEAAQLVAHLPEELAALEADERAAWVAAADAPAADEAAATAEAGIAAALAAARLAAEVEEGRLALLAATDEAPARRETYLEAREQRINAIASELAGALVSGCSCPVCGSVEHPAPAIPGGTTPRDLEEASRRVYEDAETARMALQEAQAGRLARHEALHSATGGRSAEEWKDRHTAALERAAMATGARARATELARRREELTARRDATTAEIRRLEVAVGRGEERSAQLRGAVEAAVRDLRRLELETDDTADAQPLLEQAAAALGAAEQRAARLRSLHEARTQLHVLERTAAAAASRAADAAAAAGFEETRAVLAAVLEPREVDEITALLQDRSDRDRAARATLSDPGTQAALAAPAYDLDQLAAAASAATAARDQTAAALSQCDRALDRTLRLTGNLRGALTRWAPAREAAAMAASLGAFVEGKGPDNPLRMRLSAYVLAERLRQVVAAANARLTAMSGQRYTVEQADERGAGDRRGGLSLRVRDEWTGALRDPVTLSGGETFVVSLALALGLADTVSHEAGGTDIDTLFIDEGFGSLDAETLEEVMDTLDTLREGGRTVGVVSHVPEMRERITARLEVCKSREGSTLRRS